MSIELIHGDCLEEMKSIPDGSVDMVLADPPYGIDYQSCRRTDQNQWKDKIENDKQSYVEWLPEAFRVLVNTGRLICFERWDVEDIFRDEITKAGFKVKSQIIWDKVIHGMGDLKGSFAPQHENILYATKGSFTFKSKRPKTIIRVCRVNALDLTHPNEKPILLLSKIIEALTSENDTVLDPFMGSGTTGVACVNLNRSFIGIELDGFYFDDAAVRIDPNYRNPKDKKLDDALDKFFGE